MGWGWGVPWTTNMGNRGKLWSIDDDQRLLDSPGCSNAFFGNLMGRSENAIKFRRSHLAAKMHQSDAKTPLAECVALMGGDLELSSSLLHEWNEKQASLTTFLDANRKRKILTPLDPTRSRFFEGQGAGNEWGAAPPGMSESESRRPLDWRSSAPDERIGTICKSICDEGGNLSSVFNDPQYLPILVQHYQGFQAYARVVQARGVP